MMLWYTPIQTLCKIINPILEQTVKDNANERVTVVEILTILRWVSMVQTLVL